jgi:tellurite methyltransferase
MTKAAISVERYSRFFRQRQVASVLDYGTGTLRNALYLIDQGYRVYAADLPEQVKALRSHPEVHRLAGLLDVRELERSRLGVDLVLSTYVFNIIVQKEKRRRYLDNVAANLKPGGFFLMEVCARHDENGCNSACTYFKCDSCARTYTHLQLDRLLNPYGFERLCHYYNNLSVAAIYRSGR